MLKILLPTDFSDNSWNAISYALQLYKNQNCVFTLLHTYTPVIYHSEYMNNNTFEVDVFNAMVDTSKNKLDALAKKIESQFNNPKHTIAQLSAFNTLTDEISQLYDAGVMDQIIMGTKGASGIKEVLFGSNTIHVINSAKCPVMAIPDAFTFEAPHDILFPSDYHIPFQQKQIQPILAIATAYHARVNVLNVKYQEELTPQQEANRKTLEGYFNNIAHLFHSVDNQNVSEALKSFQMTTKINILVMLNNKRSFFENLFFKSKIKQIGFDLTVPFLVIPSTYK